MKTTDFAKYLSAFLGTYMPGVRSVSTNTIRSYRDTYRLLLLYCKNHLGIPVEKVSLATLTDQLVLGFLDWLQEKRNCSASTRNQRLAAVHAFFRYVQLEEPLLLASCQRILAIPFKKHPKPAVRHLTPDALRLILGQPDPSSILGRRDLTILSLLYDTGARVQELVDLRVRDIRLDEPPVATLTGKGKKSRHVPLMHNTAALLARYMQDHALGPDSTLDRPLFVNRQFGKMTRAGICYVLRKHSETARKKSLIVPQALTPHVFRHTKAMHLYQSGVALVYIRDLLGHVDISTTDIYARADTEMKRKALEHAYPEMTQASLPDWNQNEGLLSWLGSL
jgi:site-specific recombinase XerD